MTEIRGQYFDGQSSAAAPATLRVDTAGQVTCDAWPDRPPLPLAEIDISERVGNIPRILRFPDGSQFETKENDGVDQALARFRHARGSRLVHRLESKLGYVAIAVVAMVIASVVFVRWGIPYFAKVAAYSVSAQTAASLDRGALDILDKAFFEPSKLDAATQQRIHARFQRMVAEEEPGFHYELHFREGGKIGANALALASGSIVMTDELVRLAKHDDELVAVLAHEVGHVVHRHALRRVFQSSAVALIGVMLTGDVSGPAAIVAALPTILVELQYSQAFEREADDYSLNWLRAHGVDPAHFKHIMLRLEKEHGGDDETPSFFSTHPATQERVKLFDTLNGKPAPDVK
jgi:Zn-dependent protease with chaperone function